MVKLSTIAPDTDVYRLVAEYFLSGGASGEKMLFQVGPGYGLILASLQLLFGPNSLSALIFNVIVGSLGSVLIYMLAYYLIHSRVVALVAGIIVALSTTSISLSCIILSDQPFFTIHACALVCFVLGFRTGKMSWFIAAGIAGGLGAMIRGIGQFWWLIFVLIPLLIPVSDRFSSRLSMVKKAGLTGGIMLLVVLTWSTRNYLTHDVFTFGGNGLAAARSYWAASSVANHTEDC
ncbi:MAG: phospholipid carrier-dependent glycosyltransferase, partial [candidate division Zixibacteria bacterium]|nr:phospholipid carrier-dependent glycosyltransferase [candidate division Zixibacteria bacterium]